MFNSTSIPAQQFQQRLREVLPRAGAVAMAIVGNRADAEDMVQDAAMRACRAMESYDAHRPFKGWFFSILRNCCRDLLRKRAAADPVTQLPDEIAERRHPSDETWEDLAAAIKRLSADQQQVLQLRYFGDCGYREIAEALDIPEGTVMSRLHAARKALAAVYVPEVKR